MIEEDEEQDQLSMSVDHQEYIVEDASSETDESSDPRPEAAADQFKNFTRNGMIKIGEESSQYEPVKRRFLAGMKQYARDTDVVALHKISGSTLAVQARFAAFRVYEGAVLKKSEGKWHGEGEGEGVANIMYGWYGGSKEEITQIISHGFSRCNGQSHGVGVYLSPTNFLLDGLVYTVKFGADEILVVVFGANVDCSVLASSSADENGIRHMLLCNVLMGKMEVIPAGSKQMYPSSEEFDTGVDNLEAPRRLVVWSAFMNSHIFPIHIVSFKVPSFHVLLRNQISELKKHGPISVAALFPVLVKFLGPTKKALMAKIFDDLRKCKITRLQLVKNLRRVVGDDQLLIAIIESYRDKLAVRKHQAVHVGHRQQLI
ncbi:inactive poly [Populus alba x Populus x berolinensis]|nr:inactive poly [Populus alba x Populus x berolinensis]